MTKSKFETPIANNDFPRSPGEMTVEWLNDLFRQAGVFVGQGIESIEVLPTAPGVGIVANTALIRLVHDASALSEVPGSLFVKSSAADSDIRMRIHKVGFYRREVFFYSEIAHQCSLRVPRCFFASIDEATGHSLVVLEAPEGTNPGEDLTEYSTEDVEILFRQIAAFHGQWWNDPRLHGWNCLRVFDGDAKELMERRNRNWLLFRERFEDLLSQESLRIGETIVNKGPDIYRGLASSPATLAHGDFRMDNVLLSETDKPAVIFDWQTIARVSGAVDIARFMIVSLPVQQRRSNEQRLLESYHEALTNAGVNNYPFDAFYHDVVLASANNLLRLLGPSLANIGGERRKQLVAAMVERNFAMLRDHDACRNIG